MVSKIIFATVAIFLLQSCSMYKLVEMQEVFLPDGEVVYLKCFEHNGWETIVVSPNKSKYFSKDVDYLCESETSILYHISNHKIEIYTTCDFLIPKTNSFENAIVFHVLENVIFLDKYKEKDQLDLFFFPKRSEYIYQNSLLE